MASPHQRWRHFRSAGLFLLENLAIAGGYVVLGSLGHHLTFGENLPLAPEDQGRIFERLERAVDSRHYGGLGLGLWIVRQSVEALGGVITVSSTLGQGSTFTVELPRTWRVERGVSTLPVPEEHPPP